MTGISVSVERPIQLSATSHKHLQAARVRLKQVRHNDTALPPSDNIDAEEDDVLERAYEDVGDLGSQNVPLSSTLRKLWSERGDFSKFKASSLAASEEVDVDNTKPTFDDDLDFGADLKELDNEDRGKGDDQMKDETNESKLFAEGKDVMSIQDMLQLRTQMMEKLGVAQNALYFSHALVSLLLNSTKVDQGPASGSSAARAGSPGSVSAGAGLRGGETAASTSALQRSINNVMGSPANLEAEIGIEPHVFGASRLEATRMTMEASSKEENKVKQSNAADDDDDDEIEGAENLIKEMQRSRIQDESASDSERRERLEKLVTCLESKKQGLNRATSILRKGATALRGNETRNQSETFRWQTLSQARRAGWGLIADKPLRGASKQRRDLLEDGNRKRDEASRDAWIGYAVPEAQISYRRKSLAYVNHNSSSTNNLSASPGDNLAFVARSSKTLRVELIYRKEKWISRDFEKEPDDIDEHLSRAQLEMFDAEVFDAVLGECRSIAAGSSLFSAKINSKDSLTVWLEAVELRVLLSARGDKGEEIKTALSTTATHESSFATSIVSLLRLGLTRRFRSRSGAIDVSNIANKAMTSDGVSVPILLPVIGPIHFATFLSRLKEILESLKRFNSRVNYELHGLEKLQGIQEWISTLLQGNDDDQSIAALNQLGGSANVTLDEKSFAFLTVSYPSEISLSLPTKQNAVGGRGISLSKVDLSALETILVGEVTDSSK